MRIEVWSDFACPYCYIGELRLQRALAELKAEKDATIIMRSFELDPRAPRKVVSKTPERFASKYGLSLEGALAQIEQISQLGRAEGVDFRYATTNYSNMFDAHRLAKYAEEQGHFEIYERLFAAYFTENLDLADHAVLLKIACQIGLSFEQTKELLSSQRYHDAVLSDEAEALRLGIHGVPYFIIDEQLSLSGAQPYALMLSTLASMLSTHQGSSTTSAKMCGPDGCLI